MASSLPHLRTERTPGVRWQSRASSRIAEPGGTQKGVTTHHEMASRLQSERQAALTRATALEREFADIVAAASAANADDEHDPEGATIAFERQHVAALLEQARDRLALVEESVQRVAHGSSGTCTGCGEPIPPARLAARPTATTCVACAGRDTRRR
jgi:RNA polymerase-binding transcription factor